MDADRWSRLDDLYHRATVLSGPDRASFLAQACGDDYELLTELESLLSENTDTFLDEPAVAIAARLVARDLPDLTGRQLGPYRIDGFIGAGGMGDVYHARDTVLERDVAIKILPAAFGEDTDRLARFTREAQFLASLSHPHIAAIFGVHESDGVRGLVLEFVTGETLAARIARGPVPLHDVVRITRQIGEGLDAAHQRGIVHRDLKPSNIRIAADGTVKILDFGLATTVEGSREPSGLVLGTASYMSPEQARGDAVDKRADIFAFGCVIFEMLTGHAAFARRSASGAPVLADAEPRWDLIPAAAPPGITPLLRRCLDPDPRRRRRDVGDVLVDLEDALSEQTAPKSRPRRLTLVTAVGVMVLIVAAVLATLSIVNRSSVPPGATTQARLSVLLPAGVDFSTDQDNQLAVSPDGSMVAYVAASAGQAPRLFIRRLNSESEQILDDALDVRDPFFSPDGRWVGFVAGDTIRKVSLTDGHSEVVGRAPRAESPSWDRGLIVFGESGDLPVAGIRRVSENGGPVEVISTPDRQAGELMHLAPQLLPDGQTILYTVRRTGDSGVTFRVVARTPGAPAHLVLDDARFARYVGNSVLLYQRDRSLYATEIDLRTQTTTGTGVMLFNDLSPSLRPLWASGGGLLAYRPRNENTRFVWVGRDGSEVSVPAPSRAYVAPNLSPDGDRVAVEIDEPDGRIDVWTLEMARQRLSQVTTDGLSRYPMWTPDGTHVAVVQRAKNVLYSLAPDGGDRHDLLQAQLPTWIGSFTPDAKTLVYMQENTATHSDLWAADLGGQSSPRALVHTSAREYGGRVSPDGRWLAYFSDESGQFELYVTPFDQESGRFQVSRDRNRARPREAVWAKNGRELFFRQGAQMLAVRAGADVHQPPTAPAVLFERDYFATGGPGIVNYDVTRDGQRFLMLKAADDRTPHLTVVQGLESLIRARLRPDDRSAQPVKK